MRAQYAAAIGVICVAPIAGCHAAKVVATTTGHPVVGVAAHGTIAGAFRIAGGPAPGINRPLRGTMTVHAGSSTGKVVATASVPPSGRFSVDVVPGRYVLVGTTPQITGAGGGCPAFHPVTVTAGKTAHIRVTCEVP